MNKMTNDPQIKPLQETKNILESHVEKVAETYAKLKNDYIIIDLEIKVLNGIMSDIQKKIDKRKASIAGISKYINELEKKYGIK